MYVFENKGECAGCTACKHSCPHDAITMVVDIEGFKYPEINNEKCTNCGICRKICPFHEYYNINYSYDTPLVFVAKNKDENVRLSSSSGGVFSAISKFVLDNKGIVYGAAFDDEFKVNHVKINSLLELDKLKGSKYVQSNLGDIFLDIKNEILSDRYVLFTGTPCQVAGLKAYLGSKAYKKLILVDFVCHGTPSPLIWEKYIELLQKKNDSELKKYSFRSKRFGWHNSRLYAEFNNGKYLFVNYLLDSYNGIFYAHTALRPSCHDCVFTNFQRTSDITIGDFWGIEKYKPEFDDNKGVSLLLINTEKGEKIFSQINKDLLYLVSNIDEVKQRNLTMPTKISPKREEFWKGFNKYGYEYVAKKYTTYGMKNRIKQKVIKPILSKIGILKIVKPRTNK